MLLERFFTCDAARAVMPQRLTTAASFCFVFTLILSTSTSFQAVVPCQAHPANPFGRKNGSVKAIERITASSVIIQGVVRAVSTNALIEDTRLVRRLEVGGGLRKRAQG